MTLSIYVADQSDQDNKQSVNKAYEVIVHKIVMVAHLFGCLGSSAKCCGQMCHLQAIEKNIYINIVATIQGQCFILWVACGY